MKLFKVPVLPNKGVAGSFNCINQLVRLDAYRSTDIYIDDDSMSLIEKRRRVVPAYRTAHHEYTHFLDFTTSSYGLEFMDAMFAAAEDYSNGVASPVDSENALKFIGLCADIDRDEMHAAPRRDEVGYPWEYRNALMNSRRFENDTDVYMTIMTMYSKRVNGKLDEFARAPLSIPAMLESNAVFNELSLAHAASATEDSDSVQKLEQIERLNREEFSFFYNSQFLTYSTSVHFVANLLNETEIINAAAKTSHLTRFCLDLTHTSMSKFTLRAGLVPKPNDVLHDRIESEIRNGNRTVAFYVIAHAAIQVAANDDFGQWALDAALYAGFENPLLETKKFKRRILAKMKARVTSNSQFTGLVKMLEQNARVDYRGGLYNFSRYVLPCTLLKDNLLFHPFAPDRAGADVALDMEFDPIEHLTWVRQFTVWLSS